MKTLQKLIKELKADKQKAWDKFLKAAFDTRQEAYERGKHDAFCFLIQKMELLLNTERRKNGEKCDKK